MGVLPFIMQQEGWNPRAYGDYKQTSVGYGTRARFPGEVIDRAEGERRLSAEVDQARGYVTRRFPNLAPNQTDALTSFTYNLGPGWMNQPTRLRAALESGDTAGAARIMQEYNKAGGSVLPGLVKRRNAEAAMFLGGAAPGIPAPQSPHPLQDAPMADDGWSLSKALANPMFQSGLGGFLAAARGGDTNEGMNAGSQRAMAMQRSQQMADEQARRQRMEAAFGQPGAMAGVDPAIVNIARLLGPEQGGNLIAKSLMERMQAEQGLKSQKQLIDYRAKVEANDPLRRRQIELMGQPPIIGQLKAAGIDPESPEGREIVREAIKGQNPVDQAIGQMIQGAIGGQPRQPSPGASAAPPSLRPMSDAGGDEQPQLIQAQTAQQPQAAQPAGPAGSMFSGMPPEQRRRVGEAMLASPRYKALGEQIMKDLETEKLGRDARNDIDKKELELSDNAARLQEINRLYKPEFQTIEGKFKMGWAALRDKIGSGKMQLTPEEKQTLEQYAAYRAEAFDTVNSYIKSITGAAMTNAEADRILRGIPNPGSGIFDGMSPTEFKSALDQTQRRISLALARTAYARKTGTAWAAIPITKMENIITERGNTLRRDMMNQGMSDEQATIETKKALRQEFGI